MGGRGDVSAAAPTGDERRVLRAALRSRREDVPESERAALSERACGHLLGSALWRGARVVALYAAVRGEVDTRPLLQAAWQGDKTLLLPLCSRECPGSMDLLPCPGPECLQPGYCGIPEPVPDICGAGPLFVPDLVIVPGVAFDSQGFRLGMGGGYYDRLLARPAYAHSLRVGLAFSFQLVSSVPCASWDMPMHFLCTEEGLRPVP